MIQNGTHILLLATGYTISNKRTDCLMKQTSALYGLNVTHFHAKNINTYELELWTCQNAIKIVK